MKTTPTPPDMTKEQAAELKQLRRRLTKLDGSIKRDVARDSKRIDAIDAQIARNHAKLLRELGIKQKAFCAEFRAEKRMLRTGIHRHVAGTSATYKERRAIAKRIAVLEGRLGS